MKSISKTFGQLKFNKLEKCNPKPGYTDSCDGCKNCKKARKFDDDEYPPMEIGYELRENGSIELREDGFIELRQH